MNNLPIASEKEVTGLLQLVYKDLASPGVSQVGLALARTVQFIAMPTLLLDWTNKRASIALENNLERYRKRLENHKPEEIAIVPPEIGVEILQKLTYVTDKDISEYYINLLEKASLSRSAHLGHPRFISMIAAISPDEARLLQWFQKLGCVPWFRMKLTEEETFRRNNSSLGIPIGTWSSEYSIGMDISLTDLTYPQNINKYVENILSLGIIETEENESLLQTELYRDLFEPQIREARLVNRSYSEETKLNIDRAILRPTAGNFWLTKIGEMFLDVCATKVKVN